MTEAAPPLISVRGIGRRFVLGSETVVALDDVTTDIEAGSFVAVMGPSGSGKSTFMNVIGCLDRPNTGSYKLKGLEVAHMSSAELAAIRNREMGFVFQQFNLMNRVDAVGNVELPLLYAGVSSAERRRLSEAALTRVGLGDRMTHKPLQLSGGQQQRVAIARAIVNTPAVLLADEPTGALDTRTSIEVMALFQALNREGVTVIIVTHEADIALYASRVIRFRDGRIVADERQVPREASADLNPGKAA